MTTTEPVSEVHPKRRHARTRAAAGSRERWITALGGGTLIAVGLARRSLAGLALAVAGGALLRHGVAGGPSLPRALGARGRLRAGGRRAGRAAGPLGPAAARAERAITIATSPEDLYHFVRDAQNLPRFLDHLERVEVIDHERTRWFAPARDGRALSWEMRITEDRPGEVVAWRSAPAPGPQRAARIRFGRAPGGRGTEVHAMLEERPAGGLIHRAAAALDAAAAGRRLEEDLRRLKQLVETGEVIRVDGQTSGRLAA